MSMIQIQPYVDPNLVIISVPVITKYRYRQVLWSPQNLNFIITHSFTINTQSFNLYINTQISTFISTKQSFNLYTNTQKLCLIIIMKTFKHHINTKISIFIPITTNVDLHETYHITPYPKLEPRD